MLTMNANTCLNNSMGPAGSNLTWTSPNINLVLKVSLKHELKEIDGGTYVHIFMMLLDTLYTIYNTTEDNWLHGSCL